MKEQSKPESFQLGDPSDGDGQSDKDSNQPCGISSKPDGNRNQSDGDNYTYKRFFSSSTDGCEVEWKDNPMMVGHREVEGVIPKLPEPDDYAPETLAARRKCEKVALYIDMMDRVTALNEASGFSPDYSNKEQKKYGLQPLRRGRDVFIWDNALEALNVCVYGLTVGSLEDAEILQAEFGNRILDCYGN